MHIRRLVKCLSSFLLCSAGISAQAYTVSTNSSHASLYITDGSESDIQAAINAAAEGDIIQLPAGSLTWSTGVTVNRGVTIQGAGVSSTTLTNPGTSYSLFNVTCDQVETRITGIAFKGQYAIKVGGSYTTAQFRIDDCTFDGGTTNGILLQFNDNAPGLVDHCSFSAGGGAEMIHNLGLGADNTAGWLDDVYPGSASAVYIENCTFSHNSMTDAYYYGTKAIENYYGSRTVLRYCQLNYCAIDAHGNKPPLYGARWWEFYNNTFYVPPNGNQSPYFALRGGSGVVFNNHVSGGPNKGNSEIQLYSDEKTKLPLCGPGGGIFVNGGRSFSPVYIWGNDPSMTVGSTSSNVIQGRDYIVSSTQPTAMIKRQLTTDTASTTYRYTPYVYPHPLDDGSTSAFGPGSTSTSTPTPTSPSTSPKYVQGNYAVPQTPQTAVSVTFPATQGVGNLNVVIVGWNDTTHTVTSVTDSRANNYQLAVGPTKQSTLLSQSIYYANNIAGGSNTVTIHFNGSASYPDIRVFEYSGVDPSNPFDTANGAGGSGTSSSSGSITTTNASDLLVAANTVTTITTGPGSGYTKRILTSPDGDISEDKMVSSQGSYSAIVPIYSGGWVMQIAAFRAR